MKKIENKTCPECGKNLKLKVVTKGRSFYRRKLKSYQCIDCGYSEYVYNDREDAILEGYFDDEL